MAGETHNFLIAQNAMEAIGESTVFEEVGGDHSLPEGALAVTIAEEPHATEVFPPFDTTTFASQILWLAITFGALYLIMSRVALPRIGEILETRRDRIEGDLAEAERMQKKTDQAIGAYEAALAEARSRAHAIAEDTRNAIKADLADKRRAVEADLTARVAEAETRIAGTKASALASVDEIAADTVQALVTQLTGSVSDEAARAAVARASKE